MPTPEQLPDAAAQQQAAVDVFAQYEPALYEAYLDMITEWLAAVQAAMFAGGVAQLALVPDPMTVFSQGQKWADIVSRYSEKVAREVLAAPYEDLFGDNVVFDSRPFVRNWIAGTENRLKNVPDEVFGLVQTIIDAGTTNGASIPDVQEQIEELLTGTDQKTWKNRARTIARTEVVGAYNGGLYDAFAMIVEADPDTEYVKRWLATEDHRTRPDHREADGQTVPWAEPFVLGAGVDEKTGDAIVGVEMMYPHDPAGPANQVINCRCVMLLEVAGEPTDMSNRQYKGPPSLAASGVSLLQAACTDGQFCMQTHKPGLCKGQKRGEREPGYQEETKKTPAQVAQTAVSGLTKAIQQAQAVAAQNPGNPKLAAMARKAISGYRKALGPHKQKLAEAARADKGATRQGDRDAREQDSLDRRAARQKETLKKRAAKILERRAEQKKLAGMSKKQRAAYRKAKAAAGKKAREAAENDTLKKAAKS